MYAMAVPNIKLIALKPVIITHQEIGTESRPNIVIIAAWSFGNCALRHTAAARRFRPMQSKDHRRRFPSPSIIATGRIWRPRNVLQYLPRHARQLGNVHSYQERLVAREQLRARSTARLSLTVDVRQRLLVAVAHDEARGAFLDRPGRREAAGSGHRTFTAKRRRPSWCQRWWRLQSWPNRAWHGNSLQGFARSRVQ